MDRFRTRSIILDFVRSLREYQPPRVERFSTFPIADDTLFKYSLNLQSNHWAATEIRFDSCIDNYRMLAPVDRMKVAETQGVFASADYSVIGGATRFALEAEDRTEKDFFSRLLDNETTHAEAYQLTVKTLEPERYREFMEQSIFHRGVKAMNDWIDDNITYSEEKKCYRHVAAVMSEMGFFMPLFTFIFDVARNPKNPYPIEPVAALNTFVARDETIHAMAHIHMANKYAHLDGDVLAPEECTRIVVSGMEAVYSFIEETCIPEMETTTFHKASLREYSEFVANNILTRFNCPKKYVAKNPFTFMDSIGLQEKDNLYEVDGTVYQKFSVSDAMKRWGLSSSDDVAPEKPASNILGSYEDVDF